jgi:hypothetical protein
MILWKTPTVLIGANMALAFGVLLFGARVSSSNRRLETENKLLRDTARKPYLIRNFELDLIPYLRPLDSVQRPAASSRRLILFGKDGCKFCAQQMPWWQHIVDVAAKRSLISELWLVSMNQGEEFERFAKGLSHPGLAVKRYSVLDVPAFILGTGLNGVPTTMVTTGDLVQLVHSGTYNDQLMTDTLKVMTGNVASAQFLPRGPVERLTR